MRRRGKLGDNGGCQTIGDAMKQAIKNLVALPFLLGYMVLSFLYDFYTQAKNWLCALWSKARRRNG
ncbi:MAG: hypothetical protein AAB740_02400 [Patescibacteria group bacterium]